jgi:hypothetical protein
MKTSLKREEKINIRVGMHQVDVLEETTHMYNITSERLMVTSSRMTTAF